MFGRIQFSLIGGQLYIDTYKVSEYSLTSSLLVCICSFIHYMRKEPLHFSLNGLNSRQIATQTCQCVPSNVAPSNCNLKNFLSTVKHFCHTNITYNQIDSMSLCKFFKLNLFISFNILDALVYLCSVCVRN